MREEKTYYERLVEKWQNNRPIAIVTFIVVTALAGLSVYQAFSGFWSDLSDKSEEIAKFNESVLPVYFVGRIAKLVNGQEHHLNKVAASIIELQPAAVVLHSHTSKVAPGLNSLATQTRGEHLGGYLLDLMKCRFDGEIVIIAYGAAKVDDLSDGYEQRVEIELTDDLGGIAGTRVARNPRACP